MKAVGKINPHPQPKPRPSVFQVAKKVGFEPSDRDRRVIAFIIDVMIDNTLSKFFDAVFLRRAGIHPVIAGIVGGFILWCMYWVGLTLAMGATPGKKIMGLRIIQADDKIELGIGQLFLRETVGRLAVVASLGVGYWGILFHDDRRGWHDLIAKTRVVNYR